MDRLLLAVLDEDPPLRAALGAAAEAAGLRLRCVATGAEAAAWTGAPPHLLVVDEAVRDRDLHLAIEVHRDRRAGILLLSASDGPPRFGGAARVPRGASPTLLATAIRAALPSSGRRLPTRPTVLLVDDEDNVQALYRRRLEEAGMAVVPCFRVQDALDLVEEIDPAVVATDVHLGDGDGFQLCWALRRNPRTAAVPVVIYSAVHPTEALRGRAAEAGATRLIQRGEDGSRLVDAIREVARQGLRPVEVPSANPVEGLTDRPRSLLSTTDVLDLLERIDRLVTAGPSLQPALARIVQVLAEGPLGFTALYLGDGYGGYQERASSGAFLPRLKGFPTVDHLAPFIDEVVARRGPRVLWGPDVPVVDALLPVYHRCESASAVLFPLVVEGQPIGALLTGSDSRDLADPRWLMGLSAVATWLALGITVLQARAAMRSPPPAPAPTRGRRAVRAVTHRVHDNLGALHRLVRAIDRDPGTLAAWSAGLGDAPAAGVVDLLDLRDCVGDALATLGRGDLVLAQHPAPVPVVGHAGALTSAITTLAAALPRGGIVRTALDGAARVHLQGDGAGAPTPGVLAVAEVVVRAHEGALRPGPVPGELILELPLADPEG